VLSFKWVYNTRAIELSLNWNYNPLLLRGGGL